jgi:predicted alpha/beta-fold hydrolase
VTLCNALKDYAPTPWHLHFDLHGTLSTVVPNVLRRIVRGPQCTVSRQPLRLKDGGTIALDWADGEACPSRIGQARVQAARLQRGVAVDPNRLVLATHQEQEWDGQKRGGPWREFSHFANHEVMPLPRALERATRLHVGN